MMADNELTSRLMVLMFTDLVGSVDLKTRLGARAYANLISRHDALFRQIISSTPAAAILNDTGDGFLARFATATDAVCAALRFQYAMHAEPWDPEPLRIRIAVHIGQVTELGKEESAGVPKLVGLAADITARIVSLALPDQILLTRTAFDDARQYVREHPATDGSNEAPQLRWVAHGPYLFKGSDEPLDVFEVGAVGTAPLKEPPDSEKARRAVTPGEEELLGWRPAIGLEIPSRPQWFLDRKLGEGGFGEVWIGRHKRMKTARVFKFCHDAKRVRSLKREMTLFRLLRETLGDRPDIATIHEIRLDQPPFFLESEYSPAGDLREWADRRGGIDTLPLETRLDLIARTADAVAAAHSVGILHKDIKPSNILIKEDKSGTPRPCLADFGIGVLTDPARLARADITVTGFTETLVQGNESSRTGTRLYAPPEILAREPFTIQGDVYALGVLLYQVVIGDLHRPLAQGWEADIDDPTLREDIARCVAGRREERLGTTNELALRLRKLPQRRRVRRRRRIMRLALAASVILAVLAIPVGIMLIRESGLRRDAERHERQRIATLINNDWRGEPYGGEVQDLYDAFFDRLEAGETTPEERDLYLSNLLAFDLLARDIFGLDYGWKAGVSIRSRLRRFGDSGYWWRLQNTFLLDGHEISSYAIRPGPSAKAMAGPVRLQDRIPDLDPPAIVELRTISRFTLHRDEDFPGYGRQSMQPPVPNALWSGERVQTRTILMLPSTPAGYPFALLHRDVVAKVEAGFHAKQLWVGDNNRIGLEYSYHGPVHLAAIVQFLDPETNEVAGEFVLTIDTLVRGGGHYGSARGEGLSDDFLARVRSGEIQQARLRLVPDRQTAIDQPDLDAYYGGVIERTVPVGDIADRVPGGSAP